MVGLKSSGVKVMLGIKTCSFYPFNTKPIISENIRMACWSNL